VKKYIKNNTTKIEKYKCTEIKNAKYKKAKTLQQFSTKFSDDLLGWNKKSNKK